MIDPKIEEIVPLAHVPRSLKSRPSIATIWRWTTRGIREIRLETIVIGGRRFTSVEAVARFIERLNADRPPTRPSSRRREAAKRRAADRAAAEF